MRVHKITIWKTVKIICCQLAFRCCEGNLSTVAQQRHQNLHAFFSPEQKYSFIPLLQATFNKASSFNFSLGHPHPMWKIPLHSCVQLLGCSHEKSFCQGWIGVLCGGREGTKGPSKRTGYPALFFRTALTRFQPHVTFCFSKHAVTDQRFLTFW